MYSRASRSTALRVAAAPRKVMVERWRWVSIRVSDCPVRATLLMSEGDMPAARSELYRASPSASPPTLPISPVPTPSPASPRSVLAALPPAKSIRSSPRCAASASASFSASMPTRVEV